MASRSVAAITSQRPKLRGRAARRVKTMLKYAPGAIEMRGGRYIIAPSDRLPRRMRMLTAHGEDIVRTTSSRTATRISRTTTTRSAPTSSRKTQRISRRFKGKTVRSGGQVYEFATDRRTIDRYVRAGAVHFVDIYARGAAA